VNEHSGLPVVPVTRAVEICCAWIPRKLAIAVFATGLHTGIAVVSAACVLEEPDPPHAARARMLANAAAATGSRR
jgi:hypothetical protein